MNKYIIVGVLLLVVIGGVVFMAQNKDQESANEMTSMTQVEATTSGSKNAPVPELTVVGSNFKFVPNTLSVKQGDKVKIIFQNQEGTHNLRIDALNVATKIIQGSETDIVEFTADKVGQFEYYCSIGKHRQMGMKGMLTVE